MKKLILIALAAPVLQACSFITDFYVVNSSDESMLVEVKLLEKTDGFPIFDNNREKQLLYQLNEHNNADLEHYITADADSLGPSLYTIALPPHRAVSIGRLHNQEYEHHNQEFINRRVFNLEYLKLTRAGKETLITPGNFDNYFKDGKWADRYCVY